MKAVVLAGGQGNRLRPLTCDVPKPLMPVLTKPIAEYITDLLVSYGFDDICFTLGYLSKEMVEFINNLNVKNDKVKLSYYIEEKPLGTAGCLKKIFPEKIGSDILIISGDCMCDIDLGKVMKYHVAKKADATIVCKEVRNTDEYGTLCLDEENRVVGFCEKADKNHAVSSLANCGIYILSEKTAELAEKYDSCDFSKDIFPEMLQKSMNIYAYNTDSYWCDIGDIIQYRMCVFDVLNAKVKTNLSIPADEIISYSDNLVSNDVSFIPPVFIGNNVKISQGCVLGPNAVIEDNSVIHRNVKIKNSIIGQSALIENGCDITGAVIAKGCTLKNSCTVLENACIGSGCVIGTGTTIKEGVSIWPGKKILSSSYVSENVREGKYFDELIIDGGVSGRTFRELRTDKCCRIGMAAGSCLKEGIFGIGYDGDKSSKALALAMISGLISSGCTVYDFGECYSSQLQFCISYSSVESGAYIKTENRESTIRLYEKFGLPLTRNREREIESRYKKDDFIYSENGVCIDMLDMRRIEEIYFGKLFALCSETGGGIKYSYSCTNRLIKDVIDRCTYLFSSGVADYPYFEIDSTGEKIKAVDEEKRKIDYAHLLMICVFDEFKKGRSVCVKTDAPKILDTVAEKFGCDVVRISNSSSGMYSDRVYRLSERCLFSFDSVFMMFKVLSIMSRRGKSLSVLYDELPGVELIKREIDSSLLPSQIGKVFKVNKTDPVYGYRVYFPNGTALISTTSDGRRIKILAESVSAEVSESLCEEIEEKIKSSYLDTDALKE